MFKWLYGPILFPKADRLGTYAAALAYCFVLSLVPFLAVTFVVGMQISSQLDLNKHYAEHYAEVLGDIIPMQDPHDTQRIFSAVQHSIKGGLLTVGFILAIYTSFNLMDQIIRTLLFHFRRSTPATGVELEGGGEGVCVARDLDVPVAPHLCFGGGNRRASAHHGKFFANQLEHSGGKRPAGDCRDQCAFGTFYLTYFLVPTKSYKKKFLVEEACWHRAAGLSAVWSLPM